MSELTVLKNDKLVCPFRTETKLVPNEYNAANQIVLFPECQYEVCPFYNNSAHNNTERCLRSLKV